MVVAVAAAAAAVLATLAVEVLRQVPPPTRPHRPELDAPCNPDILRQVFHVCCFAFCVGLVWRFPLERRACARRIV